MKLWVKYVKLSDLEKRGTFNESRPITRQKREVAAGNAIP